MYVCVVCVLLAAVLCCAVLLYSSLLCYGESPDSQSQQQQPHSAHFGLQSNNSNNYKQQPKYDKQQVYSELFHTSL